jgi:hypothetical protein
MRNDGRVQPGYAMGIRKRAANGAPEMPLKRAPGLLRTPRGHRVAGKKVNPDSALLLLVFLVTSPPTLLLS